MIKGTKLHLGLQEPGEKIETYKSIRVDLFHSKESVKKVVNKQIDDLWSEYDLAYESEGVKNEPIE